MINLNPLSSSAKESSRDPFKERSSSSLPSSTSNEHSSKEPSLSPYIQLSSLLHSIIKKSVKPSRRFLLSGRINNNLNIENKKNDLNLEFDIIYSNNIVNKEKVIHSKSSDENGDNIDDYNKKNNIWMSKMYKILTQLYIEK
jgi:hypothetical protein